MLYTIWLNQHINFTVINRARLFMPKSEERSKQHWFFLYFKRRVFSSSLSSFQTFLFRSCLFFNTTFAFTFPPNLFCLLEWRRRIACYFLVYIFWLWQWCFVHSLTTCFYGVNQEWFLYRLKVKVRFRSFSWNISEFWLSGLKIPTVNIAFTILL